MSAVRAYVGLGSNLGDSRNIVRAASRALDGVPSTRLAAVSRLYRTPAWGPVEQPDFVNAVAAVDTGLAPADLLAALLQLEQEAGRDRSNGERWGPRTLDLDLLLYGSEVIDVPGLRIPHPHLHERAFVVLPLAELAPGLYVPGRGAIDALLDSMATADIEALG